LAIGNSLHFIYRIVFILTFFPSLFSYFLIPEKIIIFRKKYLEIFSLFIV